MKRLLKLRYIVVSFSVLILLWYLLASVSSVGEALFPKPLTVGKALVDLFADGTMGKYRSQLISFCNWLCHVGCFSSYFRFNNRMV